MFVRGEVPVDWLAGTNSVEDSLMPVTTRTAVSLLFGIAVLGHAEASSAVSPTRYIPLRIIQLVESCNPLCLPAVEANVLHESVARANTMYAAAGMQFWIWSNELYVSPSFWNYDTVNYKQWYQVAGELSAIYPNIPSNAWSPLTPPKHPNTWLDAGAAFYSDFEHVQVFVHSNQGGSSSSFPWEGRAVQLVADSLVADATDTDHTQVVTTHLAHELGHYFGLTHPWGNNFSDYGLDPQTGQPWIAADDWDFLLCTNTYPFRTFTSRADFESYNCPPGDTNYIEVNKGVICKTQPNWTGRLICDVPWNQIDGTTTGLAIDTGTPDTPPTNFRFGINAMLYYGDSKTDRRAPGFFSSSMLSKLDRYLTYTSQGVNLSSYVNWDGSWPLNYSTFWGIPPDYTLQWVPGQFDQQTLWKSNASPLMEFTFRASELDTFGSTYNDVVAGDFDGDGLHDLLSFAGGNTTVTVRWSGTTAQNITNFFNAPATFTKVFVGDFNGDGRDDVFVYGAGSLSDYMKYGNWNRTFTTYSSSVAGTYVPFVGNFDAAYGDDIFWYYPSGGYAHRWYSTGGTTFTALNYFNVPTGGPFTPIVGNFDGTLGDDVFWYKPGSGADKLWYSIGSQSGFTTVNATNVWGSYTAASGDFDGDGRDDIYWHQFSNDSIWPGRPQGTQFASPVYTQSMCWSRSPVPGDFDGNNRTDVYWK